MDFILGYLTPFIIAYIVGGIFLLLFCVDRFDQPVKNGSFVETLVPRHLTTHSEYLRTFLIHYVIMWLIYTLLTLVGPSILQLIEPQKEGFTVLAGNKGISDPFKESLSRRQYPTWFPLAVVLILAGAASSRYPFFNTIELIVRKLTHRIIGIPDGIQNLAESLNRSRIDLSALSKNEIEFFKSKYKSVTSKDLENIDNYYEEAEKHGVILINWIRLQFLFNIIENNQRDLPEGFDTQILRSYKSMWDKIKSAIYDLSPSRISDSISDNNANDVKSDRERTIKTRQNVDDTLHDIHAIIAACVAQNASHNGDLSKIMKALRLISTTEKNLNFSQAFLVAFFIVFIFIFLVVFATPACIQFMNFVSSPHMPSDHREAFSWATSTVFLHGAAATAVLRYRTKLGNKWQRMRIRATEIPATQYIWVMLRAYFAATVGLAIWWLLKQAIVTGFTLPSQNEYWIPLFGLIGIATGFWVSYSLDIAEREGEITKTRLLVQAVMQSITTGILCFLLMAIVPNPDVKLDFEIYTGFVAALAGLIIGLIIILFSRQLYLNRDKNPPDGY